MIKKSLRAYITRRQFILAVLLDGKVFRVFFFQPVKHEVYRVLEIFIIFPCFAGVDHIQQGSEILLFFRGFIVDVADQSGIIELFRFDPEIFGRFSPPRLWYSQ